MANLSISVNGQKLDYTQLRQVKDGMNLQQAQEVLACQKDGLDTIGITIDDTHYLITGKGLQAKAGDEVMIEGNAAGKVDFVEEEENTFGEGFKAGMKPAKGFEALEYAMMSPTIPAARGLVRGTVAAIRGWRADEEKAVAKVSQGPNIDKKLVEDAAKAISSLFGGGE